MKINGSKMQLNRSKLEIFCDILDLVEGGVTNKTMVMYRCNLSYIQLKQYLDFLLSVALLEVHQGDKPGLDGKGQGREVYNITDAGRTWLRLQTQANEFIREQLRKHIIAPDAVTGVAATAETTTTATSTEERG